MAGRYSSAAGDSEEQVHLMNEDENLSSSAGPSPPVNRKSLVIFFGITAVAAAIVICTVMITLYSGKGGSFPSRLARSSNRFTFEDIFSGRFSPSSYSCNWISDNEYITSGREGLLLKDVAQGTSYIILTEQKKKQLGMVRHWISPDRKYILFTKDEKHQYRYSFFAEYHVYDLKTRETTQIKPGGQGQDPSKIQYASWDENGHSLVFVYNNNIYYTKSPSSPVEQLTDNGVEHKIFNGVPDWVYQEEVLNSDHALWFSPEGGHLAYVQFNDTEVNWYQFPWYGDRTNAYTSIRKIAYPKPGYSNPTVTIYVIDLQNKKNSELPEPGDFMKIDHYVVNVAWASEKAITVTWLNRNQDESILHMCDLKSSQPFCKQNSDNKVQGGWVDDKYTTPLFSADGSYYITLWPFTQTGGVGKFIHLAKMKANPQGINRNPTALTSGAWEVRGILAHDDISERVYFTATKESPTQLHVYSVDIKGEKNNLYCWTCNLPTVIPGNKCSYYSASFSLKGSWYILYCKGPEIPEITLRSTKDNTVVILEDNSALRNRLEGVSLPTVETYTVNSDGYDIYVKEYRPPNFDKKKKYAVLFSVYGGPASQKVVDSYGYGFESGYLVSNFDLIVVNVDARGTCCRGESFKHQVYKHLGKFESLDTIKVAEHIAAQTYVDEKKIAIWGWSYGGFLTSYVLGMNSGVFKLGMAVAPVTDWRYYDSIYTERYMLTPEQNQEGYEESSVLPLAKNFQNDSFLLVHGTGDDNVHFQNTAQLVAALTKAGIKYQVQFYPDKNHGLSGGGTSEHLYHLLTRFLTENLSLVSS